MPEESPVALEPSARFVGGFLERSFRQVLEALPAAVYATDAEGRLSYFNSACAQLSGRVPELGSDRWCTAWKLFHADGRPMPYDESPMATALRGELASASAELHAQRPDGERISMTAHPVLLRDEHGKVLGAVHMLVDTTARARGDAAGAFLAAIVASSDDAIITKSLDGVITTWNAGAERLFGYAAAEAIGRPITMLIPPDRLDEEPRIIERLRRGERVDHFETRRMRKDGALLDISLTISPVRDSHGNVIGASKVARDVTQRKRTELAQQESEERFRMIADNMNQLAWTCDSLGDVTWYNQRWIDYTGFSVDEMRGWGWMQVHHPEHVARVVERVKRAAEAGEAWEDTFPLRSRFGTYRWFLSRAVPIRNEQGEIVRWFGTNTDVTEQFEAEEALRAEDRRKNEFIATLSHELRNPLAALSSAIQVLKMQEQGDANSVQARAREVLERQVAHLTSLVGDLLEVSRVTSGVVRLDKQRIDLVQLLRHAIETVLPQIEARGHALSEELGASPIWVHADSARLAEVFVNVLGNAAKYTPDRGHLSIRCERPAGASSVRVLVRDDGIGIDAQFLPRIFDLFAQADHSLARSSGGLGIGLSVAQRMLKLHGGTIEACSPPPGAERGSEFAIQLPIAKAPTEFVLPTRTPESAAVAREGIRVLVVDDHADQLLMLTTLLRRIGYSVQSASSGPDGLRVATQWRPDIVLLDIGLPGLDGYEVARRIRSSRDEELRRARLIAFTGYGSASETQRAREAGFDAHIVKPVSFEDLQKLLLLPTRDAR